MLKKFFVLLLCIPFYKAFAQDAKPAFDGHNWKAPYFLPIEGWGIERFPIPIEFAPGISYKGIEDIRFTKGWGEATSSEYWSYAFLWFLDGKPSIGEKDIEKNLAMYYDGLIGRNIEPRKIPASMVKPTKVSISKIKTQAGDESTYSGKINMLDYMAQKQTVLNCIVHIRNCAGQDKSFVFHEISPQPSGAPVWVALNKLWADFKCSADSQAEVSK